MLGLTRSRVQQLARDGLGQKVAGRFLFSREELEQEKQRPLRSQRRTPTNPSQRGQRKSRTLLENTLTKRRIVLSLVARPSSSLVCGMSAARRTHVDAF